MFNPFNKVKKEDRTQPLQLDGVAEIVLRYSIVVSFESIGVFEKATFKKIGDDGHRLVLEEVVSYHLSVVIAAVMIRHRLRGSEDYNRIEIKACDSIAALLEKPGGKLENFQSIVSLNNRERAKMYFSRDAHGLQVSSEQIDWYAQQNNIAKMHEMPADQMGWVYYTMRIARLLRTGQEIDKFVVHHVNNILGSRMMELQEELDRRLE